MNGPSIRAVGIGPFDPQDWPAVDAAFSEADTCDLVQRWRKTPSANFEPARVWTGHQGADLWVYAVLTDRDIFNPTLDHNHFSFQTGDVFEIFLRPATQPSYCEFHFAPNGQRLHLRFPSRQMFEEFGAHADYLLDTESVESWTLVEQDQNRWRVLTRIPAAVIVDSGHLTAGDEWYFSYCRYDYTRGVRKPTLSSTSPHTALSFHRLHEWGTMRFVDTR